MTSRHQYTTTIILEDGQEPVVETMCERCGHVITASIYQPVMVFSMSSKGRDLLGMEEMAKRIRTMLSASPTKAPRAILVDSETVDVTTVQSNVIEGLIEHSRGCK